MENRAVLKVSLKEAIRKWLELTRPFNRLTNQEIDFLTVLLYHRHLIAREVKSEIYLSKILFGTELRKQLREDMGFSPQTFLNILSNLRKKGAIVNDTIKKSYIPNIPLDYEGATYRIVFDIKISDSYAKR